MCAEARDLDGLLAVCFSAWLVGIDCCQLLSNSSIMHDLGAQGLWGGFGGARAPVV